jgi:hypothetical protein
VHRLANFLRLLVRPVMLLGLVEAALG